MSRKSTPKIWPVITDSFRRLFLGRVGYWLKNSYDLEDETSGLITTSSLTKSRKLILIVARQYYFESVKDYPINNTRDLKRVIESESVISPFEGMTSHKIEKLDSGFHRVTRWVIRRSVLDSLEASPWLLIPETACIRVKLGDQPTVINRLGGSVIIAETHEGIVSSVVKDHLDGESSQRSNLPPALTNDGSPQKFLDEMTTVKALLVGLRRVLFSSPTRFLVWSKSNLQFDYPWSKSLVATAVIFAIYLSFSSASLVIASWWIDKRLNDVAEAANDVVDVRRKIKTATAALADLEGANKKIIPSWAVWDLLLDLKEEDVSFTIIKKDGDDIMLYGSAPRASDVLKRVSFDERVALAEYAAPIRKQRGRETFIISVKFDSSNVNPPSRKLMSDINSGSGSEVVAE